MTFGLLLTLVLSASDAGAPDAGALDDAGVPTTRPNLLRTARITQSEGCPNASRMSDGVASTDGDVWDTPRAAILGSSGAVVWDLGRVEPVGAMRIQADNNERYIVMGSLDGQSWYPLWVAFPVDLPGVQTRTSPELATQARYVRLTAEGGDSMYSITELELYDSQAALKGAQLERIAPPPPPPPAPPPPFDTGFLVVFAVTGVIIAYFRWASAQTRKAQKP